MRLPLYLKPSIDFTETSHGGGSPTACFRLSPRPHATPVLLAHVCTRSSGSERAEPAACQLGVRCSPVGSSLRLHLRLPEPLCSLSSHSPGFTSKASLPPGVVVCALLLFVCPFRTAPCLFGHKVCADRRLKPLKFMAVPLAPRTMAGREYAVDKYLPSE